MKKNKFLEFLASFAGRCVITAFCILVIFGVIMLAIGSNATAVAGIAFVVCAFWGWKALNSITPDIFLFMSIGGWLVYFLIKGLLSIFIGAFVAPIQIGKKVSSLIYEYINTES